MPKVELTSRFCQAAKPAEGARQTEYFDTIVRGLSLLASGKSKTWFLHYSSPQTGKRARMKLGGYPEISLAAAREKARNGRGEVMEGKDPAKGSDPETAAMTVSALVENYIDRHASTRRSGPAIARRLRKNVSDVIGTAKVGELHRRDLTRCIDRVKDRGAATEANLVFADVRAMVRWAVARGDLDNNLVEGMRRPSEAKVRDRFLTADEIALVWRQLPQAHMVEGTRRVLQLCLVTGQRVGEVCGMTRQELDLQAQTWTIPAGRAKNNSEHLVPLSQMAVEIIEAQLAEVDALDKRKDREGTPFVFPGPGARASMTGHAVAKAVKREEKPITEGEEASLILGVKPWTPHDLRRTVATQMEEMGISPFVVGHVLNHASITKSTITSRVYARYDYMKEKREALDLWASWLADVTSGKQSNVVALAGGER